MRRLAPSPFRLLVVAALAAAVSSEAAAPKAVRPGDQVKVTIGPAPLMDGENKLADIKAGTVLTAKDVRGSWVQVQFKTEEVNLSGWLHSSRLNVLGGGAPAPAKESVPAAKEATPPPAGGETKKKVDAGASDVASPRGSVGTSKKGKVESVVPTTPARVGTGVTGWMVRLQRGTWGERVAAATALYELGSEARPAVSALAEAVANEENRGGALIFSLMALGNLGSAGAPAVPALIKVIEDPAQWGPQETVGILAITVLAEIGPPAKEALPVLRQVSSRVGTFAQPYASLALASIDPAGPQAVQAAVQAFRDSRASGARWRAIRALARIGPSAKEALPVLAEAERDGDGLVRLWAICAKARIEQDPERAIALLKPALDDPDRTVRDRAREALGELQPKE